jgi:SPP1 family predicted phage head-tail adaptor
VNSDVGKLNKRIAFYDPTPAGENVENDGQPNAQPELIATVWGQIKPLSGDETDTAVRVQSAATHLIRIRYRADVHANGSRWYCQYRGRKFEIVAALDDEEERRFLLLECIEQFTRS